MLSPIARRLSALAIRSPATLAPLAVRKPALRANLATAATAPQKLITDQSAETLFKADSDLKVRKDFADWHRRWNSLPSDAALERTVKALQANNHKVTVVETGAEALKIITDTVKDKKYYAGSSQTLTEIGYTDWVMKQNTDNNLKARFVAAQMKKDMAGAMAILKQAFVADVWLGSVSAISEQGDILWASASGTRLAVHGPSSAIIVAGTNKIVNSWEDAMKRMYEFQVPLESARIKVAYKKMDGTTVHEISALRKGNTYIPPGKVHVILIKGQYGF